MRSSGISRAKPSIIRIASLLPETIRSRSLSSSSSCVGNGTNWPSMWPRRTEPIGPWNGKRRNAQRGRGAVHRQHVGVVLPIAGQHEALDLHFVVEPLGKQRPDRPVHQPRGERFLHRRPAFALEEAAGKLAGRGRPLAIVARQRKEVDARPRRARRPRRPARRFRRTAPGNCRRPAWPELRFRSIERRLQFVFQHVLSMFVPTFVAVLSARGHDCANGRRRRRRRRCGAGTAGDVSSEDAPTREASEARSCARARRACPLDAPAWPPRSYVTPAARRCGNARARRVSQRRESLADVETTNDVEVSLRIDLFQVIQQPTPATHHHQQAPPTGVVLLVRSQVLRQIANPGRQNGDLHLGRAGVVRRLA